MGVTQIIGLRCLVDNIILIHYYNYLEPEIATPPLDGLILPGVTRDSILAITKTWVSYNYCYRSDLELIK